MRKDPKVILYKPLLPKYCKMEPIMLPATPDWCGTCDGSGGRSKYDVEGYDIDAMINGEDGYDHDFADDYFGGRTDVACDKCNGKGTVLVPNYDACNDEQKDYLKEVSERWDMHFEDEREAEAERRMGA